MPAERFTPGDGIVFRHVWRGRSTASVPVAVVADDDDVVVHWTMPGTQIRYMSTPRADRLAALQAGAWEMQDATWSRSGLLTVVPQGAAFGLELNADFWYVNLQDPLRRQPWGFDSMDHQLDLFAAPDGSELRVKDQADFDEALARGLRDRDAHASVEAAAATAVEYLQVNGAHLHAHWSAWVPDPAWMVPPLPPGLD